MLHLTSWLSFYLPYFLRFCLAGLLKLLERFIYQFVQRYYEGEFMTTDEHTIVHLGIKARRCISEDRVAEYLVNKGLSIIPHPKVFYEKSQIVPDLLIGKKLYFIEIENARSLGSRRLRATLRKRIAYVSTKAGAIKKVLPTVKVGVYVISPESCEIDDWVLSNIDFVTFDLEELCDVVQRKP